MNCALSDVVLITILFYFSSGSEDSVNMITSSGTSPIPLEPPPALPPKMNKSKQVIQYLTCTLSDILDNILKTICLTTLKFTWRTIYLIKLSCCQCANLIDLINFNFKMAYRFIDCINRMNDSCFGVWLVEQNRVTKCSMYVVNISLHNRML